MSETLERVIAQQQMQIDGYKLREIQNIDSWKKTNGQREKMVAAAFLMLRCDVTQESHALKMAISDMGYCLTCECLPCECEYD